MKQAREAFEAWVRETGSYTDLSRAGGPQADGAYLKPLVERAWQGWLASRRASMKDAANWCSRQASALRKLNREQEKREAFVEAHNAILKIDDEQ